ncbi:diphthine--ammonia ligase [Nymphaea colorata]|nr:diphthine--ammonia ligase [Nymphaea colorata]XP_049933478.1 diphthine--ammonia ligase [Nymphaea colorata]
MDVVALVSGGKDSCYAMLKCVEYGHKIVALANLMPLDDAVDELDSYMYQTVGHQIVVSYATCMGIPLFRRRIKGSTRHQDLRYMKTSGDEVEDMLVLLSEIKRQIPSISAVSSGAIASDYQRLRVENVCSRLGLISLAYLWKQDQSLLLQEMISNGIVAVLIKVASMGLDPAKHLGCELTHMQQYLHDLNRLYGINVCGEGGEYETLTLDCPLFKNASIVLDKFQVVMHSSDSIAPVGILHPTAFHLEPKTESHSSGDTLSAACLKEIDSVQEVHGNLISNTEEVKPHSVEMNPQSAKQVTLNISRTRRNSFSIGCWIQRSGPSKDVQNDLAAVLKAIDSQLYKDGLSWNDVLYIHLYLADMKQFAAANKTYVSFIREEDCSLGVPSRSTVELPLVQVGLGNVYVEVLVATDQSKRVLHVQSISCWAPSCIGPYSQATLYKQLLQMAGQLGLDPPTMMLCAGGATMELKQAVRNCEAVADSFNCDVVSSGILVVVYCSEAMTSSERIQIQNEEEMSFKRQESVELKKGNCQALSPMILYILVPNLPKGALVEVKPLLYVPDDGKTSSSINASIQYDANSLEFWGFGHMKWHDSCCQKYIVHEKICMSVVSVTDEHVARLCSEADGSVSDCHDHFTSAKMLKRLARFCLYLIDKTLFEYDFCWEEVKTLRVYFNIGFCTDAINLAILFADSFKEFTAVTKRTGTIEIPMLNAIPVLGAGRTTAMESLLTCELFASKI